MLRFGTDGVRGNAETELPDAFVHALGRAVARVLHADRIVVGRDTRASGMRIELGLASAFGREGVEPVLLGVLPTPAIAFHGARLGVPAAIVSASHNPWTDNGVKVLGPEGRKLPDDTEDAIETELEALAARGDAEVPHFDDGAPSFGSDDASEDIYLAHLREAIGGHALDGLHLVLDVANGAAWNVGPRVLQREGAHVRVIHAIPNGNNINDGCGSTHPESLQAEVRAHGAALGLALDGDADRVLAVDETGALVDGDQIMVMIALDLHARGILRNDAIAVTVMSNLGLRRALRDAGIEVVETPVGDRHVVAAMAARDLALGGEQSGHVVFADHATTGDGLLTGLMVCDLVRRSGKPLSRLAAQMTRVPQVLVNVRVARQSDVDASASLRDAIAVAERALGDSGRVLVRASGTEPLVRIMVEADDQDRAETTAAALRSTVEAEFGVAPSP